MSTNEFLPFCPTDNGTNLLGQADYSVATDRSIGNQPGIASSKLVNKAMRQAAWVASQLAQFLATSTGSNVLDDGNSVTFQALLSQALSPPNLAPTVQKFTTGTGSYGRSYYFTVAAANATVGATYTNNTNTFTVVNTIAGGTTLLCTSNGAPLSSGTLTKTGGTGDSTITFTTVRAPLYIRVTMAAAGGAGSGSGTSVTPGTAGGNTTFGSSLLTCGGGGAGTVEGGSGIPQFGGAGGTATIGTGASGKALIGTQGAGGFGVQAGADRIPGGIGGSSPIFAGGGNGGDYNSNGNSGLANTGGGGQGGGNVASVSATAGSGGGSGGVIDAIIFSPAATYAWAVGAGGTVGSGGGATGGAGGSGIIIVEEFFQ